MGRQANDLRHRQKNKKWQEEKKKEKEASTKGRKGKKNGNCHLAKRGKNETLPWQLPAGKSFTILPVEHLEVVHSAMLAGMAELAKVVNKKE